MKKLLVILILLGFITIFNNVNASGHDWPGHHRGCFINTVM